MATRKQKAYRVRVTVSYIVYPYKDLPESAQRIAAENEVWSQINPVGYSAYDVEQEHVKMHSIRRAADRDRVS